MKKTLAVILTVVLAAALMVSFAACNKDTFESVDLSADEALAVIDAFTQKTANTSGYSISIEDSDSSAQYTIIPQDNASALMGTNPDGEKIFIGMMWNDLLEDYDAAGYFVYEDGEWVTSSEPLGKVADAIEDLGCNGAVNVLETLLRTDESELTISVKKNLKNGELVNYEGTISSEDISASFKTVNNGGVQMIGELTATEKEVSISYKYEYGKSFEVPEV